MLISADHKRSEKWRVGGRDNLLKLLRNRIVHYIKVRNSAFFNIVKITFQIKWRKLAHAHATHQEAVMITSPLGESIYFSMLTNYLRSTTHPNNTEKKLLVFISADTLCCSKRLLCEIQNEENILGKIYYRTFSETFIKRKLRSHLFVRMFKIQ